MENKWNLFEKFLITENVDLSVTDFLVNSVLIIIMSWLLSITYQKVSKTLSNRKDFSANFMLLAFTTMLIITIVKSSLALSLGLVGALSIVRFRAAIKEPEELSYLFFSIAMGLGLGANQRYIVAVAFVVLMLILWSRFFVGTKQRSQNLFISMTAAADQAVQLADIQNMMKKYFSNHQLKRYDETPDVLEVSFVADVKEIQKLESFKTELMGKYPKLSLSFLDSKAY